MRSTIHILFISILFLTLVSTVRAATFLVDRADDQTSPFVPTACTAAPNDCSLRGAIINANGNGAGNDTINFNIPGGGVKTIILNNRLPEIHSSMTINGASQTGYGGKPMIELNGNNSAEFGLLIISSEDISVTAIALALNNFTGDGVAVGCETRCDLTLLGNFIGVDPTGTTGKANWRYGVYVRPSTNSIIKIGGTGAFEGNIISGNFDEGIRIEPNDNGGGTAQITIVGNKIGTDYSGTVKIPNLENGIAAYESGVKPVLTIGGAASTARNVISGNGENGIRTTCSDLTVKGNYIGTNANASAALGNGDSGILLITNDNSVDRIGGAGAGEGNVISGNEEEGIYIAGGAYTNNSKVFVRGNFIGTNADGTADIGNFFDGIEVDTEENFDAEITIGGATTAERNVISGNGSAGITLGGGIVSVYNNFIGTDVTGTGALGNDYAGINVIYHAKATIGGTVIENNTTYDAGNTISGNHGNGIIVPDFAEFPVFICRNRIGTNAAGTAALQNTENGIKIMNVGSLIGSDTSAADGNTISGNRLNGILISEGGQEARIYANKIGTNSIGGTSLPNGENGVKMIFSSGNQIGLAGIGTSTNIISGNGASGILLLGESTTGNRIENNIIGAGVIGNDLGNTEHGVLIRDDASQNFVGSASGTGNSIAFNQIGVAVYSGEDNEIRRNAIFSNDELGIDLHGNGVTPNDPGDADIGPNRVQNFPVLTAANSNNIAGTLNSKPNTSYEIDFFRVDACDASGYGEGRVLLASQTVTTDGAGNASFNQLAALNLGQAVTATATVAGAVANDSSEFSNCKQVTAAPSVALSSLVYSVNEGGGSRTIVVERGGDASGTITVDYATSDGSAVAGQDYTASSGTLTFNNGEAVKTFNISVINDTVDEADETVQIALSNANGGFIGFPPTATLTIVDNDNAPAVSVSDVSSAEGSGGGTTAFTFHVTLSAASSLPVTVDFGSANGTADLSDYFALNGQVNFAAGEISKPVTISVVRDSAPEGSETFFVNLSNPTNAGIADNQGTGTIIDDDAGFSITGTIRKPDATPLSGASVQLTGNQTAQTTTDANGRYFFENLPSGGSYTITPSAQNYGFNPLARQYSNLAARVENADFTAISATPRQVQIIAGVTTPGQPATITTELVAQGDEHNVNFSLSYDSTILSDPQVALLPDSQTAILWTDDTVAGKLGIMLALPVNQSYPAGTRQLVSVTFQTALTNAPNTPVTFADTPTTRGVYDINSIWLPSTYLDSLVGFVPGGYEADVAPRPTGSGNGTVTVADVTQIGRFVAGLDTVDQNVNEFQRADNAPRVSQGDGALSVADFTQAGRYAAGLDTVQTAGGAMQANLLEYDDDGKLSADSRAVLDKSNGLTKNETQNLVPTAVRVVNTQTSPGSQVTVSIATDATGVENGFGFTLSFDASKLSNPVVAKGVDTQSAALITNTGAAGKIGVVLAMPAGQALPAGERQLVTIQFTTAANAPAGFTPLTFGDSPVLREVSDTNAGVLQSNFQDGAINILGPTSAEVTIGGRVRNPKGKGLVNILVTLTDANGQTRTTKTSAFGYYQFPGVEVGETYILTVSGKKYVFADPTRVVMVQDEMSDLDFVSEN